MAEDLSAIFDKMAGTEMTGVEAAGTGMKEAGETGTGMKEAEETGMQGAEMTGMPELCDGTLAEQLTCGVGFLTDFWRLLQPLLLTFFQQCGIM